MVSGRDICIIILVSRHWARVVTAVSVYTVFGQESFSFFFYIFRIFFFFLWKL